MPEGREKMTRRELLARNARAAGLLALGGSALALKPRAVLGDTVWQIDPRKCIQCGRCATSCVLGPSAVKCVHAYAMCGYCELCFGFFQEQPVSLDEGAENQLCPTGAIKRTFVEDPYYEYTIDEDLCIGCGRCVKGCNRFGNGSLHLQIRQDLCVQCNDCAIARDCPSRAIERVPASKPYRLKTEEAQ